ncbi:hypothetical protein KIN20_001709 [Parelaphostrongylus tenuis]|uniref:Uncharacterized protein n=1 Tax=Parelaphostrongylus tenuis TaxID=148309 RepID=A0AAD5LXD2_PARTN|nr:hypothetical protein KIN20_001709 [Parelaphostrongylus tenuis]
MSVNTSGFNADSGCPARPSTVGCWQTTRYSSNKSAVQKRVSVVQRDSDRKVGYVNISLGIACIIYGVLVELVYSTVLSVMMRKEHRQLPCYKIMIASDTWRLLLTTSSTCWRTEQRRPLVPNPTIS